MPTPIDLLVSPTSLIVFGLYAALIALEAIAPARELPKVKAWPLRDALERHAVPQPAPDAPQLRAAGRS